MSTLEIEAREYAPISSPLSFFYYIFNLIVLFLFI